MKNNLKTRKGSAILATLMVLGFVLVSALSVAFVTINEFQASKGASKTTTTYQLADEGVEHVMYEITKGSYDVVGDLSSCQSNGKIGGSSLGYEVALFDKDDNIVHCNNDKNISVSDVKKIKSVGTLENQIQRSITVYVPIACNDKNDDDYTEALVRFDGGSNGKTFEDSTEKHNVSAHGGVEISKIESKFCRSGYFEGDNGYLTISDSDDLDFEGDNFTIDFWIRPDELKTAMLVGKRENSSKVGPIALVLRDDGGVYFYASSDNSSWDIFSNEKIMEGITVDVWQHIAVVRHGDEWYGFLNGHRETKLESLEEFTGNDKAMTVGGDADNYYFKGYMDEFRISKDVARWENDFEVPEYPY